MKHRLVDGCLVATVNGISARCTCGWLSANYYSTLLASAAYFRSQRNCI